MTPQCCICRKVEENGQWRRTGKAPEPPVSHTYCPSCLKASVQQMRDELRDAGGALPVRG